MAEKAQPSAQGRRRKPAKVTYADVQRALIKHGEKVLDQIPCDKIQLSLPVDGRGPRIRVSVLPEDLEKIPQTVELTISRRKVAIPIEAVDDYETVKAQ